MSAVPPRRPYRGGSTPIGFRARLAAADAAAAMLAVLVFEPRPFTFGAFTCPEADVLADWLAASGQERAAAELLAEHADEDEEDDSHSPADYPHPERITR